MTTRFITTALAFAITAASTAALAGQSSDITVKAGKAPPADSFVRTVRYGDLDLTSADGSRALKLRVKAAARDGCGELYDDAPGFTTLRAQMRCTSASVRAAKPQMDRAIQTAANGQSGTQIAISVR